MLSLLRAWVQFLVGELRSCKPRGMAKKIHKLIDTVALLSFYRGENRLRESKATQGHRACGCWGWEANPGTLDSNFHLFTEPRGSVHRVPTSLTENLRLAGMRSVHLVLSSHNTSAHVIPFAWGAPFPSQPHYPTHPWGLSFSVTASGSPQHCPGSLKPL